MAGSSNQSSPAKSEGTASAYAVCYGVTGKAGTAAGNAAKSGKTVKAGSPRVGGSKNSARMPSVHKRGS